MPPRLLLLVVALAFGAAGCAGCARPQACAEGGDCQPLPRCDSAASNCVECVTHEQCPTGICRTNLTCANCALDTDCPAGKVCDSTGECTSGCSDANGSCPSGQFCLPDAGYCVQCATDAQCGPGRLCGADHLCVPGCSASHPECSTGQVCEVASGTCVACLSNTDCKQPGLSWCDPANRTCVACLSNADCAAPTPQCSPAKTCVACITDANCSAGSICSSNLCVPGCNAGHVCPGGQQCSSAGKCVKCVNDSGCSGATPRCDLSLNVCVECLPGAADNCAAGKYCRGDNKCERGCKTGVDCPSGVCLADHSCQQCTGDEQCAAGKICEAGSCVEGCSEDNPCGAADVCCDLHCVKTASDVKNCGSCGTQCAAGAACCNSACVPLTTPTHCGACGITCAAGDTCCGGTCTKLGTLTNCGACGMACPPGDFCDGTVCRTPTYPNFCANQKVYVIYDAIPIDDGAANVMASTITPNCPPTLTITYGQQTDPALVDQTTGAPLTGAGTTMVLAGGPWPNKPVKWLERTRKITKVYYELVGGTHYFKRRTDDAVVSQIAGAACTGHADQFVIELVTDPVNGTLALIGYGACPGGYGTQAAAFFYANALLPNKASYPNSWYIFSWTDTNNDSVPNAGDAMSQVATGP